MSLSFRSKLLLSIILIILFFGSAATYAVFCFSKDTFIENSKTELTLLTAEKSKEIKQVFYQAQLLAETISVQPRIIDYLQTSQELQKEDILEQLKSYNIGQLYSAIYIMDPAGLTLVSTDQSFVGNNYSFRDYFKQALAKGFGIDVALGVTSKKLGYYFSYAVFSETRQILGVVVVKMKPESVESSLEIAGLGENLEILLVDNFGVVVGANQDDLIFKSLGPLTEDQQNQIADKKRYQGLDIQSLGYQFISQQINSINEAQTFELFDETDNKYEIVSVAKINDLPFWIFIEEGLSRHASQALKVAYLLSIFVALAAVFAAFIITFLVIRLVGPISKLAAFSQMIAKGDFSQRMEAKSKDEIGRLAKNFNEMANRLQKSKQETEKEITQRTADLEKLNKYMVGRELKMVELKKEIKELKNKNKK